MDTDVAQPDRRLHLPCYALLLIVALALLVGLGSGVLWQRGQEVATAGEAAAEAAAPATALETTPDLPAFYLAQPASAEETFSEFICPCCGEPVGDCTCGMAAERRAFLRGAAAVGSTRLQLYLAYADAYGLDTFASEDIQETIRAYKLAHAPEQRPRIVLESQQVNLGEVSVSKGVVERVLTIRNDGQDDLILTSLSTSCGCTGAAVENNGQIGPRFGANPAQGDWSTTVPPGGTALLHIYYDPTVHAEARGPMIREVYVSSNDPVDPVVKVEVSLRQVD